MNRTRIVCVVDKDLAPHIVALICDRAHSVACEDLEPARRPFHKRNFSGNMPGATKAIVDYLMANRGKAFHLKQLAKLLPGAGMSETSISPVMSALATNGKVKRISKGHYAILEA